MDNDYHFRDSETWPVIFEAIFKHGIQLKNRANLEFGEHGSCTLMKYTLNCINYLKQIG